jgi:hypothetical protein
MKGVQATGEAFSTQSRTSNTSKHEILFIFFYLNVLGLGFSVQIELLQFVLGI